MSKAKIIGKITLDESQLMQLAQLNISDIATDNPKDRDDENEIIRRIGNSEAKGKIGSRVGELAHAFGMQIYFVDSKTSKEQLKKFLSLSDFVTVHCPYNEKTHHLMSADEFNVMKKGSYFVNNSRGGVVDEDALLNALNTGIVEFSSIDVFEKEPPHKENMLLKHPRVFVTPHCAWNTKEAVKRLSDTCINNLSEYINAS